MPVTDVEKEYKRLRGYLSPYIKGPNTDAVLYALASGCSVYLVNTVAAVTDSLYISTAVGNYLDDRLSPYVTRPPAVGLPDDVFRTIGIQIKNRKQVRDLLNNILSAMFGDEFVRASSPSRTYEPYNLANGDYLIVNFDDSNDIIIPFNSADFSNIAAAKAQEVADAISKSLRNQGFNGAAIAKNNGNGAFVELISDTIGVSSSVTVKGGKAQNVLKFDAPVPTSGNMSTQWTISLQSGGVVRFTWSGGADPQLGNLVAGDYVNIFGGGFTASSNEGSYSILNAVGGLAGASYFEVLNPIATSGIVVQGVDDAMLFYNPIRSILSSNLSYAAIYQVESNILQIFLPPATKVVRRERIGSAHIHDPADPLSTLPDQEGPYSYDPSQPYTVGVINTNLTSLLDGTKPRVISVADSSQFPDEQGYFILGYGTSHQEGPIPYIARPSNDTLLISPAYTIKNSHPAGTTVFQISQKAPPVIGQAGLNYPFYVTGVVDGRVYAQDLLQSVTATGITIVYTILYPSDQGLGKFGTEYSEISKVWG